MNLLFILSLSILWATTVCTVISAGSPCTSATGGHGECMPIHQCDALFKLVKSSITRDIELLKRSVCNIANRTVCCPLKCTTPGGRLGKCVNINSCADLVNTEDKEYIQKSRCTGSDSDKICCFQPSGSSHIPNKCTALITALPPDPSSRCCGITASVGYKILGGTATGIDDYPWLAIVEFQKNGTEYLLCGGALISGRYVLTAAHCTSTQIVNIFGDPKLVRLGEYDTSNEDEDCVDVAGGKDCTEGVTKINVETYIIHPEYDNKKKKNDIALLRLEKMAPYTDFIRPVCLPSSDVTLDLPSEDLRFYVAGWGATETMFSSPIKLDVDLPYVPLEKCQEKYSKPPIKIQLWDKQLCAGGEPGKDACRGDSGGPLVIENGYVFEAIGMVSFGPENCTNADVPGVYTKLYPYIDWIRNTITD